MAFEVDISGLDQLIEIMQRRQNVVAQLETEGRAFTDAWVAAGGRRRDPRTRRYRALGGRVIRRIRRATGNQYARGIEHVAYHRFLDWWGDW